MVDGMGSNLFLELGKTGVLHPDVEDTWDSLKLKSDGQKENVS